MSYVKIRLQPKSCNLIEPASFKESLYELKDLANGITNAQLVGASQTNMNLEVTVAKSHKTDRKLTAFHGFE